MFTLKNAALCPVLGILVLMIALSGTAISAEKKKSPAKKTAATQVLPVVAIVNGTSITREELDRATRFMLSQNPASTSLSEEQKKSAEQAALSQLISAELLYQEGRKQEIPDIENKIETQVNQNKNKFPSSDEYQKALLKNGVTENDIRDLARKEIYINNLIELKIASKISVTESDAKKFYDENKDKFKQDETVRASHILIGADSKASVQDRQKARDKAETILTKLKNGADFAAEAKENSSCPSSAQGGDLGYFGKGQMVPEFEKAAFSLKPGEISDVVETQFGYHIIKLVDKKPAGTISFDEAKQRIIGYLKLQKIQADINTYIEKLQNSAKIDVLLK